MDVTIDTILEITDLVSKISVEFWLRGLGKKSNFRSKNQMADYIYSETKLNSSFFEEFKIAIAQIEEYSSKTIFLFEGEVNISSFDQWQTTASGKRHKFTKTPMLSIKNPETPFLNYWSIDVLNKQILAKYTETHIEYDPDPNDPSINIPKNVTKIIVLSQNIETGLIQVRIDDCGKVHPHKNEFGKSIANNYYEFYTKKAKEIFEQEEMKLKNLNNLIDKIFIQNNPRIFTIPVYQLTTGSQTNTTFKSLIARSDIRDDPEFKALEKSGNESIVKEDIAGYWIPSGTSDSPLKREFYMGVNRKKSKIWIKADCLPEEVNYALSFII